MLICSLNLPILTFLTAANSALKSAPEMPASKGPALWRCPIDGCNHDRSRPFHLFRDHYQRDHKDGSLSQVEFRRRAKAHSLRVEAEMERAQRNRIPTAKAADASNVPKQVQPKDLPVTTPEYSNLPTDPAFFEPAAEITKVDPFTKVSSTTGEKLQFFHLGPQ